VATILEKGPGRWHAQIRLKVWPYQTARFRTKKEAQDWARRIESEMDRSLFVDQSGGRQTNLANLVIPIYLSSSLPDSFVHYPRRAVCTRAAIAWLARFSYAGWVGLATARGSAVYVRPDYSFYPAPRPWRDVLAQ
jgi:hypothetical protein